MTGILFLNYRRMDAEAWADRLFERLVPAHFPREDVFLDVDGGIPIGWPWAEWLDNRVACCDLMLVLIGRTWTSDLAARAKSGERDFVRVEIESALRRQIPVVPVLLGDATLPAASDLPESLRLLLGLQSSRLQRTSFQSDVDTLAEGIKRSIALAKERAAAPFPVVMPAPIVARPLPPATTTYEDATQRLIRTFHGHTELVTSVAISPDGKMAVSGSCDKSLRLWDIASGNELRRYSGHTSAVNAVAFSPDASTILSGAGENLAGDDDSTLRLWDVATGEPQLILHGHKYWVTSVSFARHGGMALSAGRDGTVRLWDLRIPASTEPTVTRELWKTTNDVNCVKCVAFHQDGRTALSGTYAVVRLWDVATGRELRKFTWHTSWVNQVAFSPDGHTALSGSDDGIIKLWDLATGRALRTWHASGVKAVAFSYDGRSVLSSSDKETIKLWDVTTGRELRTFTGHAGPITSVAFLPDGCTAISASYDKTLKLWDVSL